MEIGRPNKHLTVDLEGATFEVMPPTTEEHAALREKCLQAALKSGQDERKMSEDLAFETFAATVKSWQGVTLDGQPAAATNENKLRLWQNHNNFCGRLLGKAQQALDEHRRALEKNSVSTPA